MESIQRGGRPVLGFGVGASQSTYVKPADQGGGSIMRPTGKVGAFLGGVVGSGIAAVAATSLFGEGTGLSMATVGQRLQRSWRPLAATAVAGGIIAAIAK
jgi:hypothetical protein